MNLSGRKEIKVSASDALEFEPVTPEAPKSRFGLKLFVVLVLAGGAAGAWSLYGDALMQGFGGGGSEVPLIKAAPGPVKVRPESPGGMRVPNRDKLVYDRMRKAAEGGVDGGRGPERLLPPPEQPLPRPSAQKTPGKTAEKPEVMEKKPAARTPKPKPTPKTNPVAEVPTVKDVETAKLPAPPPPPPAPPAALATESGAAATKTTAAKPPVRKPAAPVSTPAAPAPVAAIKKTEPEAKVPEPNLVPRGRAYLIQLAAARSSKGARTEWERLKAKNPDLLGRLGLTVTRADLGPGKGIFFRLRAGPIADETAARNLCRELAKRQVGCLIIKPPR